MSHLLISTKNSLLFVGIQRTRVPHFEFTRALQQHLEELKLHFPSGGNDISYHVAHQRSETWVRKKSNRETNTKHITEKEYGTRVVQCRAVDATAIHKISTRPPDNRSLYSSTVSYVVRSSTVAALFATIRPWKMQWHMDYLLIL